MYVNKNVSKKKAVRANSRMVANRRRRVVAEDEMMDDVDDEPIDDAPVAEAEVTVDPEATELVFEAEDVAQLVAEVTGQEVAVSVDTDAVVFTVGEDEFTVEPEGDEEILETSRKVLRGKRPVKASRQVARRRAGRPIRRA